MLPKERDDHGTEAVFVAKEAPKWKNIHASSNLLETSQNVLIVAKWVMMHHIARKLLFSQKNSTRGCDVRGQGSQNRNSRGRAQQTRGFIVTHAAHSAQGIQKPTNKQRVRGGA